MDQTHHSAFCQFCHHFKRGCDIVHGKGKCTVHEDFFQLYDWQIRQYHEDWRKEWFWNYRQWFPDTCPCCKIQAELKGTKGISDDDLESRVVLNEAIPNLENERRLTWVYKEYDNVIKNGATTMACGRIVIISTKVVKPRSVCNELGLPSVCETTKNNYLFLKQKETFTEMTGPQETRTLTELACASRSGGLSQTIQQSKLKTVKIFSGSNVKEIKPGGIQERLRLLIKNIVISVKENAALSATNKRDYLPTFLNITDYSSDAFWDLLPLFITSRSMFILVHSGEQLDTATEHSKEGSVESKVSTEEQLHRWIACIHGTLYQRAHDLFNKPKLDTRSVQEPPDLPPYPQIVLAGKYPSGSSSELSNKMYSNIKAQLGIDVKDRLQILEQLDRKNELVPKFVEKLKIEIPLAWELFRSIFVSSTKGLPYIRVTQVAAIAVLCNINNNPNCQDLQSVLNFYHEHGAFLYYGDVPYMDCILILDPKWLLDQYQHLISYKDGTVQSLVDLLKTHGILVEALCKNIWAPEKISRETDQTSRAEVSELWKGLLQLLKAKHLAAKINVCEEMGNYQGDAYFVPFVLPSRKTSTQVPTRECISVSAPLHFIFPTGKYLPPGVFVRFAAILTTKGLEVDFTTSGVYRDEIFYHYNSKAELITISSTLTSICVQIQRVAISPQAFRSVCKEVLELLQAALMEVLEELGKIKFKPAFLSPCPYQDHQPHYAVIDGNVLVCNRGRHTPDKDEEVWLGTPDLENFQKCYSKLLDKINPDHYLKITAELYSCQVLTVQERDDILSDCQDTQQTGVKLLQAVGRSGEIIKKFCNTLEKFGEYQELVNNIRGTKC